MFQRNNLIYTSNWCNSGAQSAIPNEPLDLCVSNEKLDFDCTSNVKELDITSDVDIGKSGAQPCEASDMDIGVSGDELDITSDVDIDKSGAQPGEASGGSKIVEPNDSSEHQATIFGTKKYQPVVLLKWISLKN